MRALCGFAVSTQLDSKSSFEANNGFWSSFVLCMDGLGEGSNSSIIKDAVLAFIKEQSGQTAWLSSLSFGQSDCADLIREIDTFFGSTGKSKRPLVIKCLVQLAQHMNSQFNEALADAQPPLGGAAAAVEGGASSSLGGAKAAVTEDESLKQFVDRHLSDFVNCVVRLSKQRENLEQASPAAEGEAVAQQAAAEGEAAAQQAAAEGQAVAQQAAAEGQAVAQQAAVEDSAASILTRFIRFCAHKKRGQKPAAQDAGQSDEVAAHMRRSKKGVLRVVKRGSSGNRFVDSPSLACPSPACPSPAGAPSPACLSPWMMVDNSFSPMGRTTPPTILAGKYASGLPESVHARLMGADKQEQFSASIEALCVLITLFQDVFDDRSSHAIQFLLKHSLLLFSDFSSEKPVLIDNLLLPMLSGAQRDLAACEPVACFKRSESPFSLIQEDGGKYKYQIKQGRNQDAHIFLSAMYQQLKSHLIGLQEKSVSESVEEIMPFYQAYLYLLVKACSDCQDILVTQSKNVAGLKQLYRICNQHIGHGDAKVSDGFGGGAAAACPSISERKGLSILGKTPSVLLNNLGKLEAVVVSNGSAKQPSVAKKQVVGFLPCGRLGPKNPDEFTAAYFAALTGKPYHAAKGVVAGRKEAVQKALFAEIEAKKASQAAEERQIYARASFVSSFVNSRSFNVKTLSELCRFVIQEVAGTADLKKVSTKSYVYKELDEKPKESALFRDDKTDHEFKLAMPDLLSSQEMGEASNTIVAMTSFALLLNFATTNEKYYELVDAKCHQYAEENGIFEIEEAHVARF
jgi:hypothetical protein